jgi:hypothetical protein
MERKPRRAATGRRGHRLGCLKVPQTPDRLVRRHRRPATACAPSEPVRHRAFAGAALVPAVWAIESHRWRVCHSAVAQCRPRNTGHSAKARMRTRTRCRCEIRTRTERFMLRTRWTTHRLWAPFPTHGCMHHHEVWCTQAIRSLTALRKSLCRTNGDRNTGKRRRW